MAAWTAIVLLATLWCGPTGTRGADTAETHPLTAEELRYFSEEYFNATTVNSYANPHNYFLSSQYARPQDIDLYQLFYLELPQAFGGGLQPDDEECVKAFGMPWEEMPCAGYKLKPAHMSAFLEQYTGLTLEETAKKNLSQFVYLPEYDAYYLAHGDTNYHRLNLLTGEREGALIHLYYNARGSFLATPYACLTLKEMAGGGYHFRSNLPCEKPSVPTALPRSTPALTIPLEDTRAYEAPPLEVERHSGDFAEQLGGCGVGKHTIRRYRATDGNIYAAVVREDAWGEDWEADVFLTLPQGEAESRMDFFSDLFGHSGLRISYPDPSRGTVEDFLSFTDAGTPCLLARVYGAAKILDLDGDGVDELVSPTQIFYQREGGVYEADLPALLQKAWPQMRRWESALWDPFARALTLRGAVHVPTWAKAGEAQFTRTLYFDGEALLLYKREEKGGHIMAGVSAPAEVLARAKGTVQAAYEAAREHDLRVRGGRSYDDWRITALNRVNIAAAMASWPQLEVEVYRMEYQLHSATPWNRDTIDGTQVDEEGWYGGFRDEENGYLVFHTEGGRRTPLAHTIPVEAEIDSPAFRAGLVGTLARAGLLTPEQTGPLEPHLRAGAMMETITAGDTVSFLHDPGPADARRERRVSPQAGHGPDYVEQFQTAFTWHYAPQARPTQPRGLPSLSLSSPSNPVWLRCWQGSHLVYFYLPDGQTLWLVAEGEHSVFSYLLGWYESLR